jgi:NAD(P)H dehydrogenase (quinone)
MKKICSLFILILLFNTTQIMAQNKAKILVLIHSDNGEPTNWPKKLPKVLKVKTMLILISNW